MDLHLLIFARSLKPDRKCTTATLEIYIYHSVGRLQVSARFPLEAKNCGIVSPDEFPSITNLDVFKVKIKQHFLRVFLEN